jgi:hypothetical protein
MNLIVILSYLLMLPLLVIHTLTIMMAFYYSYNHMNNVNYVVSITLLIIMIMFFAGMYLGNKHRNKT